MRQPDEMERYHNQLASKIGFGFYTVVLLVWSLWNFVKSGNTGWEFVILLTGVAVFWIAKTFFARKTGL